jgi:hypothetical protein
MSDSVYFPSEAWFEAMAAQMRDDPVPFKELGAMDCTMVVQVDNAGQSEFFEVSFKSYAVDSIRRLDNIDDADPAHFRITAPLDVWREMIGNIEHNGEPDLKHTLNFLTFPDDPMVVDGPDQLQTDAFYRYNQSLQQFFNGAAGLATQYR